MTSQKIKFKTIQKIIAVGILAFSGVIIKTATNVAFPMMKDFHISLATVQWVTAVYMLTATLVIPLSAYLQKNFTNRNLFLVASILFTVGTVVIAWSPWYSVVLFGRIIEGIGNGIAIPLMFNIILEEIPNNYLGMMIGVTTLITATAGAIGPTYSGFLINRWSWRMVFIALIPLLVISLLLGLTSIKKAKSALHSHFDFYGYSLLAVGLLMLLLGQSSLSKESLFIVLLEYVIGIISLSWFIYRTVHTITPIINLKIFKHSTFSWLSLTYFMIFMVFLSMSFVVPNYVQLVLN